MFSVCVLSFCCCFVNLHFEISPEGNGNFGDAGYMPDVPRIRANDMLELHHYPG